MNQSNNTIKNSQKRDFWGLCWLPGLLPSPGASSEGEGSSPGSQQKGSSGE